VSKIMHHMQANIPGNGSHGSATADCWRHVSTDKIAAFEEGVTCKKCLAALAWRREHAQDFRPGREDLTT
jgi:hypothetical protein